MTFLLPPLYICRLNITKCNSTSICHLKCFLRICWGSSTCEFTVTTRFHELNEPVVYSPWQPLPEGRLGLTGSGMCDTMAGRRNKTFQLPLSSRRRRYDISRSGSCQTGGIRRSRLRMVILKQRPKCSTSLYMDYTTNILEPYKNKECAETAKEVSKFLKWIKQPYQVAIIQSGNYYIYSVTYDDVISENGYHTRIEYRGYVYCSIHKEGLPCQEWEDDFECLTEKGILFICRSCWL